MRSEARMRYPYYVCLNAQRKGWAACPKKSLPARGIEDSVLGQLRAAQPARSTALEWDELDSIQRVEAIRAMVERIGYDGTTRQVTIRFHPCPIPETGQEAQS